MYRTCRWLEKYESAKVWIKPNFSLDKDFETKILYAIGALYYLLSSYSNYTFFFELN